MSSPFHYSTLTRHRLANSNNSPPTTRRNRIDRKQYKRPNLALVPSTPGRKRSTTANNRNGGHRDEDDVELGLLDLPVLALARVFLYLPVDDRVALSQTCRKLRQSEVYARRHRCTLNVRADLALMYQNHLQPVNSCTSSNSIFSSTELFHNLLYRSLTGEFGSVCSIDKIARVDFGSPQGCHRSRWGGRMWITGTSLRVSFDRFTPTCLVELCLQHCYITIDTLQMMGEKFVGLEKLSVSLKGLECPVKEETPDLENQLVEKVSNWSNMVTRKKKVLNCLNVKQMIMQIYQSFPMLEVFLLYNV